MTKATLFPTIVALYVLSTAALPARGASLEAPDSALSPGLVTIRVYNYAHAPLSTAETAAKTARAIYLQAGVETRWTMCPTTLDEPLNDPSCAEKRGADVIQLRILAEAPQGVEGIGESVFGYALPSMTGGFGNIANVFWDRVADRSIASRLRTAQLLGNAMAHEVGHLMLGVGSHAKAGMMTGLWDDTHLTRIGEGSVRFLSLEAKKLQKDAAARLRASR